MLTVLSVSGVSDQLQICIWLIEGGFSQELQLQSALSEHGFNGRQVKNHSHYS